MIALVKPYLIAAGLVVGALLAGYGWGRIDGRSAGKVEQLKDTVAAIEKRGTINENVANMDGYRLCIELGGVRDDCDKLRGLEQATEGK